MLNIKFIHHPSDNIQLCFLALNITHLGRINFGIQRKSIQYLLNITLKTDVIDLIKDSNDTIAVAMINLAYLGF